MNKKINTFNKFNRLTICVSHPFQINRFIWEITFIYSLMLNFYICIHLYTCSIYLNFTKIHYLNNNMSFTDTVNMLSDSCNYVEKFKSSLSLTNLFTHTPETVLIQQSRILSIRIIVRTWQSINVNRSDRILSKRDRDAQGI